MPIELQNLIKRYIAPDGTTVPVIDVPHFRLEDGEQAALVGGSGTGKTTLLHLIAGILAPDSGQIRFTVETLPAPGSAASPSSSPPQKTSGTLDYATARMAPSNGTVDITALSEAARDVFRGRNIGYIFQTHHLLPGFTALENVLLGMSFTGRKSDPSWAKRLLDEVGLSERLHYKPAKLSVGQQQRVAVARALASRPRLVLADEPTGALDPKNAQQVLELVRRLCVEVNAALILVTHDPDISRQFTRVVQLHELNRASA